ncbi:tautomerase family protein [Pseudomonas sp. S2_H01]
MPIVNILVTREGTTPGADRTTADQKAAVYKGIADLLFNVMGKPREDTTVIFHEHEIDDISQGGLPLSAYRRRRDQDGPTEPDVAARRNG